MEGERPATGKDGQALEEEKIPFPERMNHSKWQIRVNAYKFIAECFERSQDEDIIIPGSQLEEGPIDPFDKFS